MIRFVVGPDRTLVPDLAAAPARAGNVVERVAGCARNRPRPGGWGVPSPGPPAARCTVPPDLPAVLEAALVRRIGELLGLARRAGQAVAGFEKAREWLRTAGPAGPAGVGRQRGGARAVSVRRVGDGLRCSTLLPARRLGAVFGRDHVVHVAVAPGRLAERLARRGGDRLSGLAPGDERTLADERTGQESQRTERTGANG